MPRSMTLPILAGLSILGAAGGVALGRSAIAEIDPAYFAGAPTRFHADQVPNRPDWAQVQVAEFHGQAPEAGLGTGCFGCSASPVVYAAPAVTTYGDSWLAEAEAAAAPAEEVFAPAAPDPDRERLIRYASYPVTADEQARLAEAPAEPSDDDPAGDGGDDTVAMD